jgi:hypothetical protein
MIDEVFCLIEKETPTITTNEEELPFKPTTLSIANILRND